MSPSTSPSYFFFFFLLVVSPTPTPTERSESSESSLSLSLSLESVSLVSLVSLNIYKVSASSLSLESVSLVSASKQVNGYNSSPVRDTAILDAVLNRWCPSESGESVSLVSLVSRKQNTLEQQQLPGKFSKNFQFSKNTLEFLLFLSKSKRTFLSKRTFSPWEGIIIHKPHQTSKKVSGRNSSPVRDRSDLNAFLNRWSEQNIENGKLAECEEFSGKYFQ